MEQTVLPASRERRPLFLLILLILVWSFEILIVQQTTTLPSWSLDALLIAKHAAAARTELLPSLFHQDPPHGLGRRCEEVPPAVPVLRLLDVDQPNIGLVNQRGGLQGLPRPFVGKLRGGQFTQLFIDQRQELLRGGWVA